jgi:hypothetical protein
MWTEKEERSCVLLRSPSEDNGVWHVIEKSKENTHTHKVLEFSKLKTKNSDPVICQQACRLLPRAHEEGQVPGDLLKMLGATGG